MLYLSLALYSSETQQRQSQPARFAHRSARFVRRSGFVSSRFKLFLLQEHVNLVGRDGENGPVLVSVKAETVAGQEHWRVLLRLRAGSTHELVPATNLGPNPSPAKMVKVKPPRNAFGSRFVSRLSPCVNFFVARCRCTEAPIEEVYSFIALLEAKFYDKVYLKLVDSNISMQWCS